MKILRKSVRVSVMSVLAGVLFICLGAMLPTEVNAGQMVGRDYVAQGRVAEAEGVLFTEKGEWFMRSGNIVYELHFGPEFHRDEINLKLEENRNVKVKGFLYENNFAVVEILYLGKVYKFRDENGRPLWAGRGRGDNRRDESYHNK